MKKFVVFDKDGGWAAQVEAESLESALMFICEDEERDFNWNDGDSLKVGEVVFDGKIQTSALAVSNAIETSEKLEALPTGTLLEARVDFPKCIGGMRKGDVGIVTSAYKIQLLQEKDAGRICWYGNKEATLENFNERWRVIHIPSK